MPFCSILVQHLRVSELCSGARTNLHSKKHGVFNKVLWCHQILMGYKSPTADGTDVSIWIRSLNRTIDETLGHIHPVFFFREKAMTVWRRNHLSWHVGIQKRRCFFFNDLHQVVNKSKICNPVTLKEILWARDLKKAAKWCEEKYWG